MKLLLILALIGQTAGAAAAGKPFTVCGKRVKLEIARTDEDRARGLMNRTGLPADEGMIFVFDRPQVLGFWMKNVPFDIDIGFFDPKGKLLGFQTMKGTSPMMRDEALPRYESPEGAQFALEVPRGFFKAGDSKTCTISPLP